MITIYTLVIIALLGVILNKLFRPIFKPYTYSQIKKSREDLVYNSKDSFNLEYLQKKVSRRLPIIDMSEDLEIELNKKLSRLGAEATAKDIRRLQLLYALFTLLVALITRIMLGRTPALVVALLSIYTWRYPIIRIDKEIYDRNQAIERELPELYSILFYAYKRSAGVNLTSKIQSYIKDSSDLFYKEMMIFIEDARNGELYALKEFKKRVPLGIVIRFCDIMETRLTGYDNISVMYNFKKEMDDKRSAREDKLLKDLSARLNTIAWIGVMVPMGIILIIYFAAQMMTAFAN